MSPSISVLLPVKNGERYLRAAISSTLKSMPAAAELLVLNDGSSDGTQQVLDSFQDRRLRVFRRSTSGGVAAALNSLLEESKSSIVGRMDGDDISLPWRFSNQMSVLQEYGGVAFGNVIYMSSSGLPGRPTFRRPIRCSEQSRQLLEKNPFVHPTMIAEKSVIEKVGGYRSVGAEDYDLWLRMASVDVPFSVSAFPVLMYRQHKDQVTASRSAREALRQKWFSERSLVESWAQLADREYGSRFSAGVAEGKITSIDQLRSLTANIAASGNKRTA